MIHLALAVNQTVGLAQAQADLGVEDQLVVEDVQGHDTLVARHVLGDVAAEPDGLAGLDRLGGEVHEGLDCLVVVDSLLAADDVAEAVDGVGLARWVIGTGISHQADLGLHVEVRTDVLVVEVLGRDVLDLVVLLGLVIVLPSEGLGRNGQANSDHPTIKNDNEKYLMICIFIETCL